MVLDIYTTLKRAVSELEIAQNKSATEQKYSELENPQKDALLALDWELAEILPRLKATKENLLAERL